MYNQVGWVWVTGRTPAEPADIEPKPPVLRGTEYALRTANGHRRLALYGGAPPPVHGFEEESAPVMLFLSGAITPAVHARAALLASLLTHPRLPCVENELLLVDTWGSGIFGNIMRHHRRSREMRLRADDLAVVRRRRDEMLAVISHELRSPLAAIHNAVQLLESPMTDASRRQWAQALIERQFLRMTRLLDDLLDVSRINIGHVQLQRERMDLRVAINNAIETLEREIEQRHHRLAVALPSTPVWLQGDIGRLEQVFVNLLANACKFTNTGGELAVRMDTADRQAAVRFRDSGIGIAARDLPHIFDLFEQAGGPAQRSRSGLGIGLALVREFVRLHGGSVTAHSAGPGQGSEFTVHLPTES
jgi:signal transduction histidine kinase